jgi:hypothetical protein
MRKGISGTFVFVATAMPLFGLTSRAVSKSLHGPWKKLGAAGTMLERPASPDVWSHKVIHYGRLISMWSIRGIVDRVSAGRVPRAETRR